MTTTVTINPTFAHLNNDRTLAIKQNPSSRERGAVVDIAIGGDEGDEYITGGITINFGQIRRFSEVYACEIIHNDYVLPVNYVPATGNDAKTGKLKFFDSAGAELADDSSAIWNKNLRVFIRGI